MSITKAAQAHMRRIFTESFSVGDIAEALASFDDTAQATEVRDLMEASGYQVAGIRIGGMVAGYVARETLTTGRCGHYLQPFDEAEIMSESTCFPTLFPMLRERPRLFVTSFGRVGGIVTRSDLQKPPVRMWLFGMLTIIEMSMVQLIEMRYPNERWKDSLSEGRLKKARELLTERKRRNQVLQLIDCLQFSDKGQIIVRDEVLRNRVGFESRRRGEETIKGIEALRNNLAHSQDIICCDWDTIVRLAENLDGILALPSAEQ